MYSPDSQLDYTNDGETFLAIILGHVKVTWYKTSVQRPNSLDTWPRGNRTTSIGTFLWISIDTTRDSLNRMTG